VTITRASSKLRLWIPRPENWANDAWFIVKRAEQFYHKLQEQLVKVRVGMEASGHARWFERLLRDQQFKGRVLHFVFQMNLNSW